MNWNAFYTKYMADETWQTQDQVYHLLMHSLQHSFEQSVGEIRIYVI